MSNYKRVDLLSNAAADGPAMDWPGGEGVLFGRATFGGGSLALQTDTDVASAGGGTWGAVRNEAGTADVTLTAAGAVPFLLPPCRIRVAVLGGATAAFAHAVRVNP